VKNTLATVQSIIWQALRSDLDRSVVRADIESRLGALSRSHDLLARENWKSAGLRDVIGAALEPFVGAEGRASRVHVVGEDVQFPPPSALALGIAFNELATNAVKYGAFKNGTGSISIDWTIVASPEGRRILLRWREKDGPPVTPPARKGFGSRVLDRGLAGELQGKVAMDYQPAGLVFTADFPVPEFGQHG
jgi:two-component sensor histidine kinase